jgi:hypothetical protein
MILKAVREWVGGMLALCDRAGDWAVVGPERVDNPQHPRHHHCAWDIALVVLGVLGG